ncbi:MAG TPA: pseudouridine synthase [Melioribacteraceae bacterium]|nr:pseudouridine synthase [Melioribacteraceae bacterium]
MKVRLNKFLSECGIASRRKSEEYIKEARVSVNGKIVTELASLIDEGNDIVTLDGEKIKPKKKVYFLLNKPRGYVTTTDDEKGRRKVTDLIKTNQKIYPVGRLDYDTTGVLILTNDGDFTNFLTHPKNKIPRVYKASLNKKLLEEDRLKLLKGIFMDGRKSRFDEIQYLKKNILEKIYVTATEGRNHFVKRMFEIIGYRVTNLERISYGIFNVKEIPAGSYRKLDLSEIEKVYKTYNK